MTQALSPEKILSLLHDHLGATVSILDRDFNFLYVNVGFAQAFDQTADSLVGHNVREVYNESDFVQFSPHLRRALSGVVVSYERVGRLRNRHGIWRTVSLVPWRDEAGEVAGIVMASLPVHELKVTTESLRLANERLSSHMDNSPLAVFELDAAMRVTRVSDRVQALLGLEPSRVEGQLLWDVLGTGSQDDELRGAFARLHSGQETSNQVTSTHQRAGCGQVFCEWFNSVLMGDDGQVSSLMCLVEDRTLRMQAEEKLRQMATTDQLTGLSNRAAFTERLQDALVRCARTHQGLVVLYMDLDGFKFVNDNFGHASGDEVLCDVALRLKAAVRDTDKLARVGGDEFVVLLDTDVQPGTAELVCDRIFAQLQAPCVFSNGQAPIGVSIGVAQHPPLPNQALELLQRADSAMYAAKRAGKGRVCHAV